MTFNVLTKSFKGAQTFVFFRFSSDAIRSIQMCTEEPDRADVHIFPKPAGNNSTKPTSCDLPVYEVLALSFIIFLTIGL